MCVWLKACVHGLRMCQRRCVRVCVIFCLCLSKCVKVCFVCVCAHVFEYMPPTSGQASCDEGHMVALVTHAIAQEVPQLVVAGEVYDGGRYSHYPVDKQEPVFECRFSEETVYTHTHTHTPNILMINNCTYERLLLIALQESNCSGL